MDVLLILPDMYGYYGSMIILGVGYLLGLLTCIYGWIGIELSKTRTPKYLGEYATNLTVYEKKIYIIIFVFFKSKVSSKNS